MANEWVSVDYTCSKDLSPPLSRTVLLSCLRSTLFVQIDVRPWTFADTREKHTGISTTENAVVLLHTLAQPKNHLASNPPIQSMVHSDVEDYKLINLNVCLASFSECAPHYLQARPTVQKAEMIAGGLFISSLSDHAH